jgi:hypothetical protein
MLQYFDYDGKNEVTWMCAFAFVPLLSVAIHVDVVHQSIYLCFSQVPRKSESAYFSAHNSFTFELSLPSHF